MALQSLPSIARDYSRQQMAEVDAATRAVVQQWRRVGTNFDAGWSLIQPTVLAIVLEAQRRVIERADAYVPAVLEDTGQTRALDTDADVQTGRLVGVTGSGAPVAQTLSVAPIRAKQAVERGSTAHQALQFTQSWVAGVTLTVLADTIRGAEGLNRWNHRVGYIRMVNGGACGRCVILAGRFYRTNAGFLRHPRCQCTHVPASESLAADWQTDPTSYFDSLDEAGQAKLVGSQANAQAVRDGADIGQVVNAYGKSAGMSFAQKSPIVREVRRDGTVDKFSLVTSRSSSFRSARTARQSSGFSGLRLMPESIYRTAPNRAEALRLLRINGWIL